MCFTYEKQYIYIYTALHTCIHRELKYVSIVCVWNMVHIYILSMVYLIYNTPYMILYVYIYIYTL